MTKLYLSVSGATENARIMQDKNFLENFHPETNDVGNPTIRRAMNQMFYGLTALKIFSKSDEVFEQQILEPFKDVAWFRTEVSKLAEKNTALHGWIFAKSKPYEDDYGNVKVTLSIMFPMLQTIMSMRIHEKVANTLGHLMYKFEDVLPFPLANRVQSKGAPIEKQSNSPQISEFHYLFASLADIDQFACSVEMRHYCEISSAQSGKRHLLGALLIIPGKVIFASELHRYLIIGSILDPTIQEKFFVSEQTMERLSPKMIDDFKGKLVRLAAIRWYDSGREEQESIPGKLAKHPAQPELVTLQEESDESKLAEDELTGYVRIRGRVDVNEITSKFDREVCEKIPVLQGKTDAGGPVEYDQDGMPVLQTGILHNDGEFVSYYQKLFSNDPIASLFLEATDRIRERRFGQAHGHDGLKQWEDVLEANVRSLLEFQFDRTNPQALVRMIAEMEETKKKTVEQIPISEKEPRAKSRNWWKWVEILTGKKGDYGLTEFGKEVAYTYANDKIRSAVEKSNQLIFLPDLETQLRGIPPSMIMKFLREEGKKGAVKKSDSLLFWFRPAAADNPENRRKVQGMVDEYVEFVIEQIWNMPFDYDRSSIPLPPRFQSNGLSSFTAKLFCDLVEKNSVIEAINGVSATEWHFPLEERILRLFRSNPHTAYTVNHLASMRSEFITIPGNYEGLSENTRLVEEALESLQGRGLAKKYKSGWALLQT